MSPQEQKVAANLEYWQDQFRQYREFKEKRSIFILDLVFEPYHCSMPMQNVALLGRNPCPQGAHSQTRFILLHSFLICRCCGEVCDPPDYGTD